MSLPANDSRSSANGSVLRGVSLDPRPVTLRVPGARSSATSTAPVGAAAPAPSVPVESMPGYDEGYRAGLAQGEAAQRARDLTTVDARQQMAFEQGLEEGRQRGIAEGRELGRATVEREAKVALDAAASRIAQLDQLLASVAPELTRRLNEAEADMVALCHAVLCRILGDAAQTPEGVAQLVRQAIRESGVAGGFGQLAVHVHPRALAMLEADADLAVWLRQHASAGAVQWVPDESVALGGCVVRSAEGSLDARLETQLDALRALLAAPGPAASPGPAPVAGVPARPGGAA